MKQNIMKRPMHESRCVMHRSFFEVKVTSERGKNYIVLLGTTKFVII